MSSFPSLGFDPAPGDLSAAQGLAERVAGAATTLRETADVLAGTGRQDWQGRTAEAFHGAMDAELTPRARTAAESFTTAAGALETWATSLAGFQRQAEDLELRARAAVADVDQAAGALHSAHQDPEGDVGLASTRLHGATAALDGVRAEAHSLAGRYDAEASYVATCLSDAQDAAPDQSFWGSIGDTLADIGDFVQEYVLPVLEDIIDIALVVVGVAVLVLILLSPAAPLLAILGPIGLGLGLAAVGVDAMQWAGGREGPEEMLIGLGGLLLGGAVGKLATAFQGMAGSAGGMSGLVLAGVSGGTATAGATATLAFNPVGPLATFGYLLTKATGLTNDTIGTVDAVNNVGNPVNRTVERFRNLFTGNGLVLDRQKREAGAC